MGMYTELVLKCNIKEDIPEEVTRILEYLFSARKSPLPLPEHKFFTLPRWSHIGHVSSYYHHPYIVNSIVYAEDGTISYIFSRSDLKNYDGEIEAFIDWLKPYIDYQQYDCIGWIWYEEDSEPTLLSVFEDEANV